ncbi:MAG: GNAT family N-acetyltransferase [Nitriliruptorales bacterium]|nr:GNAT family N-acetyltransferase [Nitriliruptorales bacterium]
MLQLELLEPHHELHAFESGNAELDEWLQNAGMTAHRAGTARVYVWCEQRVVYGYFAIAPHMVHRVDVPSKLGRGSPDVIPGFLLARLAIHSEIQGQGRGAELLILALETMLEAIRAGGGRILVVDAIDENAISFYEYHGFKALPDNPSRLFLKASSAAKSIGIAWP